MNRSFLIIAPEGPEKGQPENEPMRRRTALRKCRFGALRGKALEEECPGTRSGAVETAPHNPARRRYPPGSLRRFAPESTEPRCDRNRTRLRLMDGIYRG